MAITINNTQGVWGEFKPVLDPAAVSVNGAYGVYGEYKAILDEAAAAPGGGSNIPAIMRHRKFLGVS